ncbi:hypothetical protein [Nocardiopsis sp. YSL2]|uniref:hypothetical protein n=1 Tax=Nocardiopsis sp. YSL2 TaxID=2939492 RepID=UPI0026F46A0C|nr:hypothetical protein [Nocardiopsis sp. YSL2]
MSVIRQRAFEWTALLAVALGVFLALFSAAGTLVADHLVVPVEVPAAALSVSSGGGFAITGTATADLTVADPTTAERAWTMGPSLLVAVLIVLVGTLLLRVVRSLRTGDPFAAVNARRVGVCAAAVVVGGAVVGGLRVAGAHAVVGGADLSAVGGAAVEPLVDWPVGALLLGLGLASAAEFLRRGALLNKEVEGLV